ncbi:MAG: hypothetical protein PQJ46_05405 [Spirochaetales bacterium]|nr:hypothetical protein [Spirochaetales bacterium]
MMKGLSFKSLDDTFRNSIYGNRIYNVKFSSDKSPHITADDPANVFASTIIDKTKHFLLPMVTLDLKALNPDFTEKIPVLYHEHISMDWVVSKLDDENKICEMMFYDGNHNKYDLASVDATYQEYDGEKIYFQEGIEEITDTFKYRKEKKSFHIEVLQPVPEFAGINDQADYEEFFDEWRSDFFANNKNEKGFFKYDSIQGPYPIPAQNGFCYPHIEGAKTSFLYVGYIDAYNFGGIGMHYYMFYNPAERIVAQLMQMT